MSNGQIYAIFADADKSCSKLFDGYSKVVKEIHVPFVKYETLKEDIEFYVDKEYRKYVKAHGSDKIVSKTIDLVSLNSDDDSAHETLVINLVLVIAQKKKVVYRNIMIEPTPEPPEIT